MPSYSTRYTTRSFPEITRKQKAHPLANPVNRVNEDLASLIDGYHTDSLGLWLHYLWVDPKSGHHLMPSIRTYREDP